MGFKFKHLFRGIASVVSPFTGYHMSQQRTARREAQNAALGEQMRYNQQQNEVRAEQNRINQQINQARTQTNAGIARVARGRTRGGIFGDSSTPGPAIGARLG